MTKNKVRLFSQCRKNNSDLSWNINTFLTLYLDRDRNTLLCGDILADLLAVVPSAVVLQVHYPALHISYALERLW